MEGLVGIKEIYSVQLHGGFDFQVGVNSIGAVQTLLGTGGLRLGTRTVPLVPVARQEPGTSKWRCGWKTHFRTSREWEAIKGPLSVAAVGCTTRKTYSTAVAMDVEELRTLGAARAAGQKQRRLTSLRPAKRLKPSEYGPQPNVIPEKRLAQATAITAPAEQQEARQADSQTLASMRVTAVKRGRRGKAAMLSQTKLPLPLRQKGPQTAKRERRRRRHRVCSQLGQRGRYGSQGEREVRLKGKTGPAGSTAAQSVWCNKKGDEDDDASHGRDVLQSANDRHPNSSVEQEKSVKAPGGEDTPKQPKLSISSRQQPLSFAAGRELNMASNIAKRERSRAEKTRWRQLRWKPRKQRQHRRQTSLSPASSLLTSAHRNPQALRGTLSSNCCRCRLASAEGGTAEAATPRPPTAAFSPSHSGPGRLRGRTAGSEHEEATSKQRPSKKPVADDMDTDSDLAFPATMCFHSHPCQRGAAD
ncbi:hypothetical protein HPB52_004998 [Rhipicephalus sanguineus]|uniref:Uncharacterized protein n=1 Tax=Rhipicephalus sanguineus TaxID=34632 RepID=A0A9D4Q8U5_RHISA|nr:hypothetical protein HPB52_004998 [Rhipicephalus sanguineus]